MERRRKLLRLPQFDYSSCGAYFVTICAFERKNIFGEIVDGEMRLNHMGQIVKTVWEELPSRFSIIELDECVIMPNHFHGIVFIMDSVCIASVGAGSPRPPAVQGIAQGAVTAPLRSGTLGQMMAFFKYVSTKNINKSLNRIGDRVWQKGYHDHVIRNDADLNRIRQYIQQNPQKWAFDRENVGAGSPRPPAVSTSVDKSHKI